MVTDARCDAPQCNRAGGHAGLHGYEPDGSGLVLAPWSDLPRQSSEDGDPIPCNSCGKPLTLHRERCRASCECGQMISFDDRGYSQSILPRLYPSKVTDPQMLRELGQYRLEEWAFFDTLMLRFGLIDEAEFAQRRLQAAEAHALFMEREVLSRELELLGVPAVRGGGSGDD